jgi:DNA mismatch repair protein MutS
MAKRNPADTPLMRQFLQVKAEHPDAILFFRLGDFYEMFFDDAVVAAETLDLTLTSRDKGRDDAVPMCGVPHHSARAYIAKLVEHGHKVVLCEQVEDPRLAKGLVKREVVRIITPGVMVDEEALDPARPRYLAAVVLAEAGNPSCGLAYLDVTTGEFRATELAGPDVLADELARVAPSEVLVGPGELDEGGALAGVQCRYPRATYGVRQRVPVEEVAAILEAALGPAAAELPGGQGAWPLAVRAAAEVIAYARATQPGGQLPLSRLQLYRPEEAMVLDETAIANLELVSTLIGGQRAGSLLSVLDQTCTAPGGRLLRQWLLFPLTQVAPIRRRQDAVEYFVEHAALRAAVRAELKQVHDIERLAGRISLGVGTPRDLARLRASLARLPEVAALVAGAGEAAGSVLEVPELLRFTAEQLAELAEIHARIDALLVDEPPAIVRDGGLVRAGHCRIVDENRGLAEGGKDALLAIEQRERERTGISSLKVKYNRVFGYYIEVTRAQLGRVPDDYIRKQTVATGERFVTPELAELEGKIQAAQETLAAREQELFDELCQALRACTTAMVAAGNLVAVIDCCAGLAQLAHARGYVRPEVADDLLLEIVSGRHPVVESVVPTGAFVPNDCRLEPGSEQILLITGPNMAGKSTYMRQVAHIVLLAQIGSFVPAARAHIGLCDRIFTRVGAADNLARGESTFMVEMREAGAILRGASRRSLVILDEVGRGTSTFDGVSIAWAVTEYLHDAIGARTLFASHYHELCALGSVRPRIRNVSVAVREHAGEIVFLRQVVPGGASRSYGIDVARLAGLPGSVIARARQILARLEQGQTLGQSPQLDLFATAASASGAGQVVEPQVAELLGRLRALEPERTTPLDALALLASLREQALQLES